MRKAVVGPVVIDGVQIEILIFLTLMKSRLKTE